MEKIPSVLPSVHFLREGAPTIIWVSRSWGLPRSTSKVSLRAASLWHFQGNRTISRKRDLGSFPAVSPALRQTALAYGFARHEHYGHLSTVRAWTFLYGNAAAAITRTLLTSCAHCSIVYFASDFNRKFSSYMYFINKHYFAFVLIKNQSYNLSPNTCFSKLDNRRKIS